ncbi:MAG: prolyl oligopeptidase family serine peptidase [Candidatus Aminicenantes bacterium]|nr:prolyl oligopeptidase family serine peptidase [Candidatus Aminicenantes bacterium]
MNEKLKQGIKCLCVVILVFSFASFLSAQIRGKALYKKLTTDRDLIKEEGLSRVSWLPDGTGLYFKLDKSYKKMDLKTGDISPLFNESQIIMKYNEVSGDKTNALPFDDFDFINGRDKIRFKVSSVAFIYDLDSHEMISYVPENEFRGVRGRIYSEVLSPDLQYRAFVRDYNLYIKDFKENETQLTYGGHKDLRKGFPDWVYPEELGQYQAFWWSPDSQMIAYMEFDESPVKKYPIVHDINPAPELEMQSYPKAGTNNPIIQFYIINVQTQETVRVKTGMETNVYLFKGKWTEDGEWFTYQRLNRHQNVLELYFVDPKTGEANLILKDKDPCYIQADDDLVFLEDRKHFIWTSERSGWKQIYLYDMSGRLIEQLTHAELPINRVVGVDEEKGWIYFTGQEHRGLESYLYRIGMDGEGFEKLLDEVGTHSISMSPDCKHFVDYFSNYNKPRKSSLYTAVGEKIRELGHSVITKEFKDLDLIMPEHFVFKSADGKYTLDGVVYKPAHFNAKETYPLIMSVYGGPGAKRMYNRFDWNSRSQALAQLGFVVASIDHRGVSGRGKDFQNLMYMNLGQIELADHVAAVKFLIRRPYIDAARVGIYGHSYGGYLTCIAMLKAPDVFHVGVAGAPVTDWRNYDTIYTERYMRRPQDNPEGYEKGSCMNYAQDLKGHLAIHHGAVDNNVHPGNTIQLVQALLKENKKFELMMYPEQRHGIRFDRYGEARVEFFIEHLKPEIK